MQAVTQYQLVRHGHALRLHGMVRAVVVSGVVIWVGGGTGEPVGMRERYGWGGLRGRHSGPAGLRAAAVARPAFPACPECPSAMRPLTVVKVGDLVLAPAHPGGC